MLRDRKGLICTLITALTALGIYNQSGFGIAHVLAHMIPAITDGLMRLPIGNPIVTSIEDPLLRGFYLAFLVTYLIGVLLQIGFLRRASRPA